MESQHSRNRDHRMDPLLCKGPMVEYHRTFSFVRMLVTEYAQAMSVKAAFASPQAVLLMECRGEWVAALRGQQLS